MKIYAPNKEANGVYASVLFVNGVGETDNPHLIEWFRSHGYHVPIEETVSEVVEQVDVAPVEEPELMGYAEKVKTFEEMTPIELREWAVKNGFGSKIRNIRNKEKLLEILRG
jgi:hypothetical protein